MDRSRLRRLAGIFICAFVGISAKARADADYQPIAEAGLTMHSGTAAKSLTGTQGYFIIFRSEKKKGIFRPKVATQFDYGKGTASLSGATPAFTLYGADFLVGFNMMAFGGSRFQPWLGADGILAWQYFKMPSPPTGIEANTQGFAFGYEVSAGVDLRLGSKENALRMRAGYWQLSSSIASTSGFILNGFRFGLGYLFK